MRAFILLLFLLVHAGIAVGQNRLFGSIDDPAEQSNQAWWESERMIGLYSGLSLIGPQWRSEGRITADLRTQRVAARITGILRAGIYGTYQPDVDEAYDLLRLIEFVRFKDPESMIYLRIGPLDRTRLGTGHVVNFFSSETVWNERTVGIETAITNPVFQIEAFADNVSLNGLAGARLALTPFGTHPNRRLRSVTAAINGIRDLADRGDPGARFSAYHVDLQMEAVHSGAFSLNPFISYARTRPSGQGLHFGADLRSDNFIDLARIHFRLALHYSSRRFLPGYAGSFWQVQNSGARVVVSEDSPETDVDQLAGIAIEDIYRSHTLETEFRILIFERFELWYQFLRHYAGQATSEYHLRLFLRAPRFRLAVGQDRGGLRNFFSLFNDLGDLTTLHFESAYRISEFAWILVDARYTYRRHNSLDSGERFVVSRRFDPLVGMRLIF